jgi:hypothetical protein
MLEMKGIIPKIAKYLVFRLNFKRKYNLAYTTKYIGCIDGEEIAISIGSKSVILYFDESLGMPSWLDNWAAIYWLAKKLGYVKNG